MSEDEVLEGAISYLVAKGRLIAYRTRKGPAAGGEGYIAGVDAVLCDPLCEEWDFLEAKGSAASPQARSTSFTNVLGGIVRRMHDCGYRHNEDSQRFLAVGGLDAHRVKERINTGACLANSRFFVALPGEYSLTLGGWPGSEFCRRNKLTFLLFRGQATDPEVWPQ